MEKTFEERKKEHLDYLASLPKKVVIHGYGAVNFSPSPAEEPAESIEIEKELDPTAPNSAGEFLRKELHEKYPETALPPKMRNDFTPLEIVRLGKAIGDMSYEEMDKVLAKSDGSCDSIVKIANTPEFRRNISKRLEREKIIKGLKTKSEKRL